MLLYNVLGVLLYEPRSVMGFFLSFGSIVRDSHRSCENLIDAMIENYNDTYTCGQLVFPIS